MAHDPRFTICLSIGPTNAEREAACALYERAFNAVKTSESVPPGGTDLHITMDLFGVGILIGPGNSPGTGFENSICCEARFEREEEFRRAYDALAATAKSHVVEGPYEWADQLGLVVDQFGIGWALYYNAPRG